MDSSDGKMSFGGEGGGVGVFKARAEVGITWIPKVVTKHRSRSTIR